MNESLILDPNVINTLIAVSVSVLYSFFKPESLSHDTKKKISMILAVMTGVSVSLYTGRTSAFDFVAYVTMAAGVMQGFYIGIMEKMGAESMIRGARNMTMTASTESMHRVIEAGKVLMVHSNSSAPKKEIKMPPVVQAIEEVNAMLRDWRSGTLSNDAAVIRMNEIRVKYGSVLPPFPIGYPL